MMKHVYRRTGKSSLTAKTEASNRGRPACSRKCLSDGSHDLFGCFKLSLVFIVTVYF